MAEATLNRVVKGTTKMMRMSETYRIAEVRSLKLRIRSGKLSFVTPTTVDRIRCTFCKGGMNNWFLVCEDLDIADNAFIISARLPDLLDRPLQITDGFTVPP